MVRFAAWFVVFNIWDIRYLGMDLLTAALLECTAESTTGSAGRALGMTSAQL